MELVVFSLKGHTIPRLKLCGAVLASELGETICDHLNFPYDVCHYYTDSQVALGYICNTTRRCFTYVANRVEKIHRISKPSQWSYIVSDKNPADFGIRFLSAPNATLINQWLEGPDMPFIQEPLDSLKKHPLISPNDDDEIRPEVVVFLKTIVSDPIIGTQRFIKF